MRKSFSNLIESGRVQAPGYPETQRGDLHGHFLVRCERTNAQLRIILSSSDTWASDGMSGAPWEHVSVSTRNRCPTWEEMAWVKRQFFEDEECVIQYHPPKSAYINVHPFVLHLWRPTGATIPMPPLECV
jgi:hypothetical protein